MEQIKNFASRKSYEYSAVAQDVDSSDREQFGGDAEEQQGLFEKKRGRLRNCFHRYRHGFLGIVTTVIVVAVVYAAVANRGPGLDAPVCDSPDQGFQCRVDISHSWGQYSPYYKVPSEIDPQIPQGCEVTFAQVLARHGARDPTAGKTVVYRDLIEQIHENVTSYSQDYRFLRHYNYSLGADQLTDFGRQQLVNAGIAFYERYNSLATYKSPFVRSAGQERVVESAKKWTEGFHRSRLRDGATDSPDRYPYDILVIPEADTINNTLSDDLCRNFDEIEDPSVEAQTAWVDIFATPIAQRLNEDLPGANFSTRDTIHLMEICPFETVADSNRGRGVSPFCDFFTADEWKGYDYYQSLGKWYGYGNGHLLGPTRGVGFVNELVARLTSKAVRDHTSTNSTLDSDPDNFPLAAGLYADFSHDNDMASIFAAMGLYNETKPLASDRRQGPEQETKGYSASWSVPFASRMYVEKMRCSDGIGYGEGPKEDGDELVRVLVNDRVIPLQNCGADELGRCELGSFIESLDFATEGGHWGECFSE